MQEQGEGEGGYLVVHHNVGDATHGVIMGRLLVRLVSWDWEGEGRVLPGC